MDFIKKNGEGITFLSGFGSAFSCFGKIVSGCRRTSVCNFNWNDTRIGD